MSVDCSTRPPLTKEQLRQAAKEKRLVPAKKAPEHGIPKATVDDWVARGWLKPVHDGPPRLYLTDDLYDLRRDRRQYRPTRGGSGKFVRRITPE